MEKNFASNRLNLLFAENAERCSYSELKSLMSDILNNDLQEGMTKKEAEDAVRNFMLDVFDINAEDVMKPRVWRQAQKKHMDEYFELIEEIIEERLESSLNNSDLMKFAEVKNLNDGDKNQFYLEEKTILSVGRVSGDHHDLSIQHFKTPSAFTVPLVRYGVKIGDDIRQYLLGRKDLSAQIDAVAAAFEEQIAKDVIAEIAGVGSKLPASASLNKAITMPATGNAVTKDSVREEIIDVISKVRDVNNGANVVIMGTRNAIAKLEAIQDLDWLSSDAKNDKYSKGRIAYFDEATLISVPQKYTKESNALKEMIPNNFLLIVPTNAEQFIKIVNSGDVATEQINEVGAYVDDLSTYEMQKTFGVAAIVGEYIGYIKFND